MTLLVYFIGILTGVFATYLGYIIFKTCKDDMDGGTTTDAAFRQVIKY